MENTVKVAHIKVNLAHIKFYLGKTTTMFASTYTCKIVEFKKFN